LTVTTSTVDVAAQGGTASFWPQSEEREREREGGLALLIHWKVERNQGEMGGS